MFVVERISDRGEGPGFTKITKVYQTKEELESLGVEILVELLTGLSAYRYNGDTNHSHWYDVADIRRYKQED